MAEHEHAEMSGAPLQSNNESLRAYLADLTERAAAKDAVKDFNAAAELYSEATELQAKLNGELSLDNADLLYSYGKSLYNVAVSKSDVLGSKVAGESQTQLHDPLTVNAFSSGTTPGGDSLVQDAISSGLTQREALAGKAQSQKVENKTYFQFTGDENFDASDSDEEDKSDSGEGAEEDEDDFANAFEVLDLARILYLKKLNATEEESGKGKTADLPPHTKQIKERLADTYDLQAEISLEAERFTDAVTDLRTALELRQSLFPMEDPSIAECHYKLSLALEFASVNKADDDSANGKSDRTTDEQMRKEAASQMEKAIESCQVRMAQEQKILDNNSTMEEDKATAMKRKIANVKDIIADMEQRLVDLKCPPVSLEDKEEKNDMLKGILGQIMGQSPSEQMVQLDKVSKGANDLSAFVKRRSGSNQQLVSTQKRSAQESGQEGDVKRTRVDNTNGPPT
ncbi:tetratricopeptide repeat domain protein [Aspergillus pseudotamarii]|uniref:Tetratricopeptide repeat domain protein n=1 Tax=Aspergillus pseudotamarii TaxID=132259 RepID=A0A5N6SCT9_ASPPS|nr:tetratricopeptide repeat domain protein [Aspergillus pseudotamarii]KAE8132536.1 tetratricopeptide repeat domain protein [Aspergillus pseudotamarii]